MNKKFIIAIGVGILLACMYSTAQKKLFWGSDSVKYELLELHNKVRVKNHKPEFEQDKELDRAAQFHAEWMAKKEKMSHDEDNRENRSVTDRVEGKWSNIAENIAAGQLTPEEVVKDWMNSSGHKKNILNSKLKHIGFGVAKSKKGTIYWCVDFTD